MSKSKPIYINGKLFLGRVEEQKQFRAGLSELLLDDSYEVAFPFVFLLYGDGGIGKSTLAKRFRDIAHDEVPFEKEFNIVWIDWEDEHKRFQGLRVGREYISPETVFDVMYTAMVRSNWEKHFKAYEHVRKQRQEAEKKAAEALTINDDKDEYKDLRNVGASTIAKVIRLGMPIVGDTGEKLVNVFLEAGIKVGAEQAMRLKTLAETQLRARLSGEHFDLFTNPNEGTARAFADGLKKLSEHRPTIVFLDTYEIVDRTDIWLRMTIEAAGPNLLWVISGRNNLLNSRQFGNEYLKGYAEDFPSRLVPIDVRQLALEDVRLYFKTRAPRRLLDQNAADAIRRATRGIPLALEQAADMWEKETPLEAIVGDTTDATPQRDIVRKMTERYMLHVITAVDKHAIYALALARGDVEILRAMLRPDNNLTQFDLESLIQRLERDYASVYVGENKLHDEPALFIIAHLKERVRRTSEDVKELIQKALTVLRQRFEKSEIGLEIEERCEDEDWVHTVLEIQYYLFWLDEEEAWKWLVPRFVEGIGYSRDLRRGLLQIIKEWQDDLSARGQKRLKIFFGIDVHHHENEKSQILDELYHLVDLGWLGGQGDAERLSILDLQKGRLLFNQGKHAEAFTHYQKTNKGLSSENRTLRRNLTQALIDLAYSYQDNKQNLKAHEVLTLAINLEPINPNVHHLLGHILHDLKREEESIKSFQKAIELEPDSYINFSCLGNMLIDIQRFEDAVDACLKSIRLNQKDAPTWNRLGLAYRSMHNFDEAVRAFSKSIELDKNLDAPRANLGRLYANTGNYTKAIETLKEALKVFPQSVRISVELAYAYREMGRYADGIEIIDRALQIDPNSAEALHELGHIEEYRGAFENAVVAFSKASKASELEKDSSLILACLSRLYRANKQNDKAFDILKKAMEINPNSGDVFHQLGHINLEKGYIEEAINSFQKAIVFEPWEITHLACLGDVYRTNGRGKEAINTYEKAIKLNPKSDSLWNYLGNIYCDLNRLDDAIVSYEKALEIDGFNTLILNNLGIVHLRLNHLNDAVKIFKRSLAINKNSVYANISLVTCFRRLGKPNRIKRFLDATRKIVENDIEYYQACFEAISGNRDRSLSFLETAVNKGQTSRSWALHDPNLDDIRNDPRFKELIGE